MTTKKVDLQALKANVNKDLIPPHKYPKVKIQELQTNKTLELFKKAEKNETPLLNRDTVSMMFNTTKEKDGEIRELVFDNGKVTIRTSCPATKDIQKDELVCYGESNMTSKQMMGAKGLAVKTDKVVMETGVYPRMTK